MEKKREARSRKNCGFCAPRKPVMINPIFWVLGTLLRRSKKFKIDRKEKKIAKSDSTPALETYAET
jgi:hypothetical protein